MRRAERIRSAAVAAVVMVAAGVGWALTIHDVEVYPAVPGDFLGWALAASGDSLLVGAPGPEDGEFVNNIAVYDRMGRVEVFRADPGEPGEWQHQATLELPPGSFGGEDADDAEDEADEDE